MKLFLLPRTLSIFAFVAGIICFSNNNSQANVDTIYAGIPIGQFGSNCVDANNFPGNIISIQNLCPDSSGIFANFSIPNQIDGCVNYYGIAEGPSLGCFEICDDQQNCDTILIYLNTDPIDQPLNFMCDTLIGPEVINISIADCAFGAEVCLPIRFDLLNSLEIYDNGVLYNNGITGCNIDTTIAYTYNNLFGQGAIGPYMLDSWTINGTVYSGEYADINALLDSMNVWDTLGTWVFDPNVPFTIVGGFSENFYGPIISSKPGVVNSTSIMGTNYGLTPLGSEITIAQGQHLITIVDNISNCTDSVTLNIVCLQNDYMTLQTYTDISGSVCVDTSDLVGDFSTLTNACPSTGVGVDIFPNDVCVDWQTLEVGNHQICLVACDNQGFCDTTFIDFQIFDPQPDTIDVFLDQNDSESFCVDSTELFGLVNNYAIAIPPSTYSLTLDTLNDFCLEITSTAAGNDFACVVICDDQGGCDTTCYNIIVDGGMLNPPLAVNDNDTTAFNTPIAMNITANDTFMIGDTITILTQPSNGTIVGDSLGNYVYTPNPGTCGLDSYNYQICNSDGCDEAIVSIVVECEEVIVYNGFSPNGDQVNDNFTINGLEAHPDHKVYVYNRWGNLVYQGEEYRNNWGGVWEGKPLPPGTYFYLVELNDEANTRLSGLVCIAY